ncbi:MAG: hypothetical protein ABEI86_05970, partial [Halobacteriaceae archaeon]
KDDQAKSLDEETEQLNVEFYLPNPALNEIGPDMEDKPDLILVDWVLHQKSDYEQDGISFEGRIREFFSDTPIFAFRAEEIEKRQSKERFDLIFELEDLTAENAAERLIDEIKGYEDLLAIRGDGLDSLMELLDVPEDDREEHLPSVLPQEFSEGVPGENDYESGAVLRLARWIRNHLIGKPGLTWNQRLTATKVGVSEEAFEEEYQEEFRNSVYTGPFSTGADKQWWKSRVIDRLIELSAEKDVTMGSPWRSGPEIL